MNQLTMNSKITGESAAHMWQEERAEDRILLEAVRRLNSTILGIVLGLLHGIGLFIVTLWLVIKGGPNVGQHLSLLNQFLPGYSVTVGGSFVGLLYGLVIGFTGGWFVGWVYNSIVGLRHRKGDDFIVGDT